jgi:zinc protease
VLPNGLTVYVIEDHRQPLMSYELVLNAGSIMHDQKRAGLAFMTAQLLRQGTKTRKAQDIARLVDNAGGSLSASADDDVARVTASFMKSYADLGIELLADVVQNPAFAQEELDRQRRQMLSGLQIQYTDAAYLASLAAARTMFGEHPYGYPTEGTPDTLRALTRDDLAAFHRQFYSPKGAFLAVSGDVTP